MSTNAASIAVLNVTLGYRDLFVTLSTTLHTYSSPRDLNLGYWEAIPWTKIYRRCLRANFEFNDSYKSMHRLAEKHMAFRRIVGSLTPTIDANFRNHCPGSSEISAWALSMTARVLAFFRATLPSWNFHSTVLKPYILPQCHKWSRISKESNYFRCWAPSAKTFDDRGSSIICIYFENMTVY